MTATSRDELERKRFVWPEPLVIELICDHHVGAVPAERRLEVAKLHDQTLRAALEASAPEADLLRRRLDRLYDDLRVAAEVQATIDRAVIAELIRLVEARFRHSPRLRDALAHRMEAVLAPRSPEPADAMRQRRIQPTSPRARWLSLRAA